MDDLLMHVYFDTDGEIRCISPEIITEYIDTYRSILMPVCEVENFITQKWSTHDYFISITKTPTATETTLVRKKSAVLRLERTLDSYLTEITENNSNIVLSVNNYINIRTVVISLHTDIYSKYLSGTVSEKKQIVDFVNCLETCFFFTKKRDPYLLLHTIDVSPTSLMHNGRVEIKYTTDLSNASVYTCKSVNGFNYSIHN